MKAAVYANGSDKIGMGHIIRTMAIAEVLKLNFVDVDYICTSSSESCLKFVSNKNYNILHELPSKKLYSFIVVDSYDINCAEELLNFYKIAEKVVYIDDLNKLSTYDIDILINYSVGAETIDYRGRAIKLLGSKYTPLRQQFLHIEYKEPGDKVENVLITMGAADEFNYTEYVVSMLIKEFPSLKYNVVIGTTNNHKKELLEKFNLSNVSFYENVDDMASMIRENDIAVSAGGSTVYELCTCSIPTLAVITADNQKDFIKAMNKKINLPYVDFINVVDEIFLYKFYELYNRQDLRIKLSNNMKLLVDGKGAERIIDIILQ